MARPSWRPTAAERSWVARSAARLPLTQIAKQLGVSVPTLRRHCTDELRGAAAHKPYVISDVRTARFRRNIGMGWPPPPPTVDAALAELGVW